MMYPLEAPNGWFLWHAKHEHTGIIYKGDVHTPKPYKEGPWLIGFQKYPSGGMLIEARGHTLEQAWANAIKSVEELNAEKR